MSGCCVYGCQNRFSSSSGLKLYRIPKGAHPFQQNLWLQAIKRVDENWTENTIRNARVCSAHFISGEVSLDSSSPDFVPSVFTYTKQSLNPHAKMDRYQRKRRRDETSCMPSNQLDTSEITDHQPSLAHHAAKEDLPVPRREYDGLQQRYAGFHKKHVNLQQEFKKLKAENCKLKEELKNSAFSYANIRCNRGALFFFTGLTTLVFDWLLTKTTDSVEIICQKLTAQDHLLVVLMKLRLGLSNTDLAYRFNVSKTTVSNICRSWIPAMSVILKPLIKWPSKGAVLKSMPKVFRRNFKRCRCIIDCTEIFIARPSNLTSRAQTWSNYKHSNTIKYLIGITPAGAISFLSPGWGGRVSDKQITKESGLFDLLEHNDEILADRGFQIRDELAACGATLRIPHFTKGKKQLSAQEVDSSRQLSRVRIHVERVIGRWKNCKILQTVIPVSQLNILDDIVIVCAALTNLCKSVVPKKTTKKYPLP
uniref:Cyclin-dependent kinase 2 associated protein 2 n=1 Tax=Nothobranchius korthausae TaxID=1143690 RepID=A0A1A8FMA8_9TELE